MVNTKPDVPIETTVPISGTQDQQAEPRDNKSPPDKLDRYITVQEQLATHQRNTQTNLGTYTCQFCGNNCGRSDNLRSHIRLHAEPSKPNSQVAHYDEAVQVLAEMTRMAKRSTGLVEPNSWPVREDRGRKAEGQHALDDYKEQLVLLDQKNKKRRREAFQEHENMMQQEAQKVE